MTPAALAKKKRTFDPKTFLATIEWGREDCGVCEEAKPSSRGRHRTVLSALVGKTHRRRRNRQGSDDRHIE
jgi:hypothetical protein